MNLTCIKKLNTATGKVEVHILSAQDNYQTFAVQTDTPITLADAANFDWAVDVYGNLVCIKKSNTATGTVEVHILSAQSTYQTFAVQTGTPITLADAVNFDFRVNLVLGAIKRRQTATGTVEIHMIPFAWQQFILQTGTPITLSDAPNFDFTLSNDMSTYTVLGAIKRRNTATGTVEVHTLSAKEDYQAFVVQTGTPITLDDAANFDFVQGTSFFIS
jgi:hypothetical protein